MSKVKIVKAKTFVLNPKKKYMIVFDKRDMTMENGRILLEKLRDMGLDSVGVGLEEGDDIKVVELPNKENENV